MRSTKKPISIQNKSAEVSKKGAEFNAGIRVNATKRNTHFQPYYGFIQTLLTLKPRWFGSIGVVAGGSSSTSSKS